MFERVAFCLASFAMLFLAWLAFVDELSASEAICGMIAAVLATWGSEVVRGEEQPRFWPHARWFLELWRLPWDIVSGCGITAIALIKGEPGLLHEISFDPGQDDRSSAARRAVATALTTISPNSMVVGIDSERRVMLIHMADHGPVPYIARYLGAAR